MNPHAERVKRELRKLRASGHGAPGVHVPELVRQHPDLAVAAVGLQQALDDLLSTHKPSAWRAAGRLLHVLQCEDGYTDTWAALRDEFAAAFADADEAPDSAVPRLLAHLDDALYELSRLAPEEGQRTG